jgi:acetyltransferase
MSSRNLEHLRGGFRGPIWPVNLPYPTVAGREAYLSIESLPSAPDLAVICTPAPSLPGLSAALGARGTRAAVVISAGFEQPAPAGVTLATAMLHAARPFQLRILGPNCIGLLVPRIQLARAGVIRVGVSVRYGNDSR